MVEGAHYSHGGNHETIQDKQTRLHTSSHVPKLIHHRCNIPSVNKKMFLIYGLVV